MAVERRPVRASGQDATGISSYYRAVLPRRPEVHCAWSGGDAPVDCELSRVSQVMGRKLVALTVITAILASDEDQQEKLLKILAVLRHEFGLIRGTVMLLAPDGQHLTVEAMQREAGAGDASSTYRRGEGITGRVLASGQTAVVPDIDREPGFHDRIHRRKEGAGPTNVAFVCVPITLADGDTIGTLSVDRPDDCPLAIEDAESVLVIVATLIAHSVHMLREAQRQQALLTAENARLRAALGEQCAPRNLVGSSGRMRSLFTKIAQVSPSSTTVLLRGESGTGKEQVASAIHFASERADRPFVRVNCAALNENLLESELFGHEKGAFTGATQRRIGRMEEADGGTLFLDEIGEFTPGIQVKLLRVLQEREFERVGSNETRRSDVRIVAATNRDLEAAVREGAFRNDLYYRINVFPIVLPPLRDRREDVLALANHFVAKHTKAAGKEVRRISTSAIDMLMAYHWPGNVRELENCIQYALVLCRDGVIHGRDLPPTLQMPEHRNEPLAGSLTHQVEQLERDLIIDALKRNDGKATAAARELGVTPRILRYKIKNLDIRTD
ncbi:MAG: sigma 54-interacting transcriptional regulator [Planctomycetota bacterium]